MRQPDSARIIPGCLPINYKQISNIYTSKTTNIITQQQKKEEET